MFEFFTTEGFFLFPPGHRIGGEAQNTSPHLLRKGFKVAAVSQAWCQLLFGKCCPYIWSALIGE